MCRKLIWYSIGELIESRDFTRHCAARVSLDSGKAAFKATMGCRSSEGSDKDKTPWFSFLLAHIYTNPRLCTRTRSHKAIVQHYKKKLHPETPMQSKLFLISLNVAIQLLCLLCPLMPLLFSNINWCLKLFHLAPTNSVSLKIEH